MLKNAEYGITNTRGQRWVFPSTGQHNGPQRQATVRLKLDFSNPQEAEINKRVAFFQSDVPNVLHSKIAGLYQQNRNLLPLRWACRFPTAPEMGEWQENIVGLECCRDPLTSGNRFSAFTFF
jgi:hypothetical protein